MIRQNHAVLYKMVNLLRVLVGTLIAVFSYKITMITIPYDRMKSSHKFSRASNVIMISTSYLIRVSVMYTMIGVK